MTFDEKSYDLACYFLSDEPELNNLRGRNDLAAEIQRTIEDWIEAEKSARIEATKEI